MKKVFFLALAIGVYSCAPCDEPATPGISVDVKMPPTETDTLVTISFINPTFSMEPMSVRSRAALSSVSTKLDLWLSDGETIIDVHQTSTDVEFGSVSLTLNKLKTYTLYAVAHKCDAAATLADGVISFPDDKVKDTFWYTTSFSPATATTVNCIMSRIVSMFRIETTDAVPTDVKKIRITQRNVFDRWNVSTGATNNIDRISTINVTSTASDGTVALSVYAIVGDAETAHDVTVETLDDSDQPIQIRTFVSVPMRNGYKTVYRGAFFTNANMSMSFTASDWSEYDTTNF